MIFALSTLIASRTTVSELEGRVEALQEKLDELKLERGNSVRSVFDKFDADESNSLSMSEFKRMVSSGAVELNEERGDCAGCTCARNGKYECDCDGSYCSGSDQEICIRAMHMKSTKPCDYTGL